MHKCCHQLSHLWHHLHSSVLEDAEDVLLVEVEVEVAAADLRRTVRGRGAQRRRRQQEVIIVQVVFVVRKPNKVKS